MGLDLLQRVIADGPGMMSPTKGKIDGVEGLGLLQRVMRSPTKGNNGWGRDQVVWRI